MCGWMLSEKYYLYAKVWAWHYSLNFCFIFNANTPSARTQQTILCRCCVVCRSQRAIAFVFNLHRCRLIDKYAHKYTRTHSPPHSPEHSVQITKRHEILLRSHTFIVLCNVVEMWSRRCHRRRHYYYCYLGERSKQERKTYQNKNMEFAHYE